MKAISVHQPWASLIMAGAKPFEFRKWPVPKSIIGTTIVIHASKRIIPQREIDLLLGHLHTDGADWAATGLDRSIAREIIEQAMPTHIEPLPLGAGLGFARLGEAVPAHLIASLGDSDRIDHHVWAWPITGLRPFASPEPAKGKQGFWNWSPTVPSEQD